MHHAYRDLGDAASLPSSYDNRYMTAGEVREHFGGVSDMWIRRHQAEHGFPAAIKFGGPTSSQFWKQTDVLEWERAWIRRGTVKS